MHFKSNNALFYTQLHLFLQKVFYCFSVSTEQTWIPILRNCKCVLFQISECLVTILTLISWNIFPLVQEAKILCFFNGITFLEIWRIKLWFLKAWYSLKVTFFLSVSSGNVFDTNTKQISWEKKYSQSSFTFFISYIVYSCFPPFCPGWKSQPEDLEVFRPLCGPPGIYKRVGF